MRTGSSPDYFAGMKKLHFLIVYGSFFLLKVIPVRAQMQFRSVADNAGGPMVYGRQHPVLPAVTSNPAALTDAGDFSFAVEGGNAFGIAELKTMELTSAIQAGRFHSGLHAALQGGSLYHESELTAMAAHRLGEHLDAGVAFSYHTVRASGYRSFRSPGALVGIRIHPMQGLTIGFAVANPGSTSLPFVYNWGVGYEPSPHLFAGIEIRKQAQLPATLQAVIAYTVEPLYFRAGMNSSTFSMYFGAGYRLKRWQVMVQLMRHPQLGSGQVMGLQYNAWKSKGK